MADGGLLAWEALTADARRTRPGLPPEWCLAPGEPASLLPPGFTVLDQSDVPGRDRRRMLARRDPRCRDMASQVDVQRDVDHRTDGQVGDGWWCWAHWVMSRRSMAAAIRSGKASGVQANAVTPSPASAAALSWS